MKERGEVVEEGEAVEDKEVEGDEAEDGEIEDSPPAADQFDLAKLFAGPIDFKILEVRIAFLRTPGKSRPYQWRWAAVFAFLRGIEGWTPQTKKSDTEYRFGLPVDDWIKEFGKELTQVFITQPKEGKTTGWLMKSNVGRQPHQQQKQQQQKQQQQQQPSHAGTAVPAFGAPLPKAPQLPPRPTSTSAPTPSEPVKGSKNRTLEQIDAEEEELEREEERLAARRKQLREERRQLYRG